MFILALFQNISKNYKEHIIYKHAYLYQEKLKYETIIIMRYIKRELRTLRSLWYANI